MTAEAARLRRVLGLPGAVATGLGSMLGTGVFVGLGLAAADAGRYLPWAIGLAAMLAMCNGLSSAGLAANHPVSGGTYEYGYRLLSPGFGFLAGWMFLAAKSASAGTAALAASGAMLLHLDLNTPAARIGAAVLVVAIVTALLLSGLRRTSMVNLVLVSVTMIALGTFVACAWNAATAAVTEVSQQSADRVSLGGVLSGAGLVFVAFTGYGRVATLGEEVVQPARTIPIAVVLTVLICAAVYLLVAGAAMTAVGAHGFAAITRITAAPLEYIVADQAAWVGAVVAIGAVTALMGVLLNLNLGLSRVLLAMARRGDMPRRLAGLNTRADAPAAAIVMVGVVVGALTVIGDIRVTWTFSAMTVLLYYGVTNLAAMRLPAQRRRLSLVVPIVGLAGCAALVMCIPLGTMVAGLVIVLVGLVWFHVAGRHRAG